jgi:hypothetical protein
MHNIPMQIQVERKQSRYSKGVIIAVSRQITQIEGEDAWLVESETKDGKYYKVTADRKCECADSQFRSQICKHIYSVIRWATG